MVGGEELYRYYELGWGQVGYRCVNLLSPFHRQNVIHLPRSHFFCPMGINGYGEEQIRR